MGLLVSPDTLQFFESVILSPALTSPVTIIGEDIAAKSYFDDSISKYSTNERPAEHISGLAYIFGGLMPRFLLVLLAIVFTSGSLFAQVKTYDYNNLTADEIQEIKELRHEFYEAKSVGKALNVEQIKKILSED